MSYSVVMEDQGCRFFPKGGYKSIGDLVGAIEYAQRAVKRQGTPKIEAHVTLVKDNGMHSDTVAIVTRTSTTRL